MRTKRKKNIYLENWELQRHQIAVYLIMTNDSLKTVKNSSNFTSWTAFIHQNAPFWKATQCYILKLKKTYCNHGTYQRHMELYYTRSHRDFLLVQKTSWEPENCLQKHSTLVSLLLHTDTLGHDCSSSMTS